MLAKVLTLLTLAGHPPEPPTKSRVGDYLRAPRAWSVRQLDHGVLEFDLRGGIPERYGVGFGLGLLDHLTLGLEANWLPGGPPRWGPRVDLAFFRGARIDIGLMYRWQLYPNVTGEAQEPASEVDPPPPAFQPETHWLLGTASFFVAPASVALELGTARTRVQPVGGPGLDPYRFDTVFAPAGGIALRVGSRRLSARSDLRFAAAREPLFVFTVGLQARVGAFERRDQGSWFLWD